MLLNLKAYFDKSPLKRKLRTTIFFLVSLSLTVQLKSIKVKMLNLTTVITVTILTHFIDERESIND